MSKYFFTADTHFGNPHILEHGERPFNSVAERNATLIKNWNEVVGPKDYVYHLGDFGNTDLSHKGYLIN